MEVEMSYIQRMLIAQALASLSQTARFLYEEVDMSLIMGELIATNRKIEQFIETFTDSERSMYDEDIASQNEHPKDLVEEIRKHTDSSEIHKKTRDGIDNMLSAIREFVDEVTLRRNLKL